MKPGEESYKKLAQLILEDTNEQEAPTYLTVDPGLAAGSGTGWALWKLEAGIPGELISYGTIPRVFDDWQEQAYGVLYVLQEAKRRFAVQMLAIEYPHYYQGGKGQVAASSGSLIKLAVQVGLYASIIPNAHFVPVTEWKGQLPKTITRERVASKLQKEISSVDHNAVDAIGIGLYLKGEF